MVAVDQAGPRRPASSPARHRAAPRCRRWPRPRSTSAPAPPRPARAPWRAARLRPRPAVTARRARFARARREDRTQRIGGARAGQHQQRGDDRPQPIGQPGRAQRRCRQPTSADAPTSSSSTSVSAISPRTKVMPSVRRGAGGPAGAVDDDGAPAAAGAAVVETDADGDAGDGDTWTGTWTPASTCRGSLTGLCFSSGPPQDLSNDPGGCRSGGRVMATVPTRPRR